jgi:hypothetical protein
MGTPTGARIIVFYSLYGLLSIENMFWVVGSSLANQGCFVQTNRHPDGRSTSARIHQRASRPEGPCVFTLETLLLKHKVSQGYSPAGENAGSLTPFEMTSSKTIRLRKNPNCTTTKKHFELVVLNGARVPAKLMVIDS